MNLPVFIAVSCWFAAAVSLASAQNRWEGQVMLRLSISADGRVTDVEIVHSSGYQILDEAAARAVREWHGTPAMLDGQPVATVENLPIRFRVK